MIQVSTLDFSVAGLDEMSMGDMALIDGGLTPYEAGRAVGTLLQIAATIVAFL